MKESTKEDVKKVANSSLMRFESLNFQPALIAIQNMNSINTQPIIKAMEMQQENTKSIMNSFKLMQEINTTPMLESLEGLILLN